MKYKQMDLLADLHTHSIGSVHAFNTIDELIEKAGNRYIAVTDHVQNYGSSFLNFNHSQYINDIRRTFKHEPFLIAGAEIDVNIPTAELGLDLGKLDISILSYHKNAAFDITHFMRCIDIYKPTIIAHPMRYSRDPEAWEPVLKYAVESGCIIEINECSIADLDIKLLQSLNCSLSLGSDAHHYRKVLHLENAIDFVNTYLADKHVVNFDRGWLQDARAGKFNKHSDDVNPYVHAWSDKGLK